MRKPAAPEYKKLTVKVTEPQHEVLLETAAKLGDGVPVTEVIRKSLMLARIIIMHYDANPAAPESLVFKDPNNASPDLVLPVRALLELGPPDRS